MLRPLNKRLAASVEFGALTDHSRLFGPMAGILLVSAGVMSFLLTALLPSLPGTDTTLLMLTGLAAICSGIIAWRLPWHRWPAAASHLIVVVSFGLIAVGDWATSGTYRYNLFYVAAFTWIGLLHRRGTALRFMPVLALFYLTPAILRGDAFEAVVTPFIYTMILCLLLGETVAWLSTKLRDVERELAEQRSQERFGVLVKHLSDIIVIVDADARLRFVSPSVGQALGYPPPRILGRNALASIHPDDRPFFKACMRQLLEDRQATVSGELRFRHFNGGYRDLEILAINEMDNEHVQGLLFTARDITNRKATDLRLREAEVRYRSLIEQLPAMTYIETVMTERHVWVKPWVSPQSREMFGYTAEEWARGINFKEEFVHPDDFVRVQDQALVSDDTHEPFDSEYRVITRDGRTIWVRDYAELLRDADGAPLYWQGIMFDISAQKQLESRLEHLALYDQLTGLPNRLMLVRELEQKTMLSGSVSDSIALLFLDLDNFKLINDSYGHAVGDQVISILARRLQQVAGRETLVAHFGGDEFVMLLNGSSAGIVASEIARRSIAALKLPMRIDRREISVTASIGIAYAWCGSQTADDLLRDADVAMFEAKARGRNQFVRFDSSMQGRAVERLVLESDLRTAIAERQFELHYQPIVDLRTGRIAKLEALLRWRHPRRGLLTPDQFIAVAEESGQILEIDHFVLQEASRQARAWQALLGPAGAPIVSVNLSPQQFLQPSLVDEVRKVLRTSGISPTRLELEITEHAAMGSPEAVVETLQALKALDVQIALDDFGTGYSGLSYLTRFPINTLKIDRSFVTGMHASPEDLAIVRTILAFSDSLGLESVAEGIELASQREQLLALGCTYGQGFYFSRPYPAHMILDQLTGRAGGVSEGPRKATLAAAAAD